MHLRFLGSTSFPVVLVAVISIMVLSACGGDSTATPVGTGESTATSTPYGTAGTPLASGTPASKPVTEILSATTCRAVDASLNPIDPTSTFGPNDTVYLSVDLQNFPKGTRVNANWYFGGQFLNSYLITANKDYVTTRVSFNLKPTAPFSPGKYRVEIYLNDYFAETVDFSVSANPPTSIPSPSGTAGATPGSTPSTTQSSTPMETPSTTETPGTPTTPSTTPTPSPESSATPSPESSPTPSPSPSPTPSPTPGTVGSATVEEPKTYASQNLHFSTVYPQNWTVKENGSSVGFISPEPNVQFFVSSQQAGPNDTVEGLNGALLDAAKSAHPDLSIQGNQKIGFAGETWLETDFSYTDDKGVRQNTVDWVALHKGTAYVIVINAPQASFNQNRQSSFQPMRDNFKFTP